MLAQREPGVGGDLNCEAVSGYVNFELAPDYLAETIRHAAEWLARPRGAARDQQRTAHFLIGGPVIGAEVSSEAEAYGFISEVYGLIGYRCETRLLLADASEEAAELIAAHLKYRPQQPDLTGHLVAILRKERLGDVGLAALERAVRGVLSGLPDQASPGTRRAARRLRGNFVAKQRRTLMHSGINVVMETESRLRAKVQRWLDKSAHHDTERVGIIANPLTRGVYYRISAETFVSLRTATGILRRDAYLLYALHRLLGGARDVSSEPLLALIPESYHALCTAYAEQCLPDSVGLFLCADPRDIQANLAGQEDRPVSLAELFAQIAHALLWALEAGRTEDPEVRTRLLYLLDIPADLEHLVVQFHPLELATFLGRDIKMVRELIAALDA